MDTDRFRGQKELLVSQERMEYREHLENKERKEKREFRERTAIREGRRPAGKTATPGRRASVPSIAQLTEESSSKTEQEDNLFICTYFILYYMEIIINLYSCCWRERERI